MTPIQLPPLPAIKERIRTSINAGVLQCQQPGFEENKGCSYIGPCAIGVVMTPEQRLAVELYAKEHDEDAGLHRLLDLEVVVVHHDADREVLESIQLAHDNGSITELRRLIQ